MMRISSLLLFVSLLLSFGFVFASTVHVADAKGTVLVRQHDGETKTYRDVTVKIREQAMALISADGRGRIVLGKAGCTKVGELLRCTAYDATLDQYGRSRHIPLITGTVWLNPTNSKQQMTYSSQQLAPRGILGSFETKRGTYVSLTGTVDEVEK